MTTSFKNDTGTGAIAADGIEGGLASNPLVGKMVASRQLSLPVTATANTDLTLAIPPGSVAASFVVYTTTGYGAATDATIQIGSTAGGVDYVAATTIKAVGIYALTRVNAAAASFLSLPNANPNIFIRIVQSGAASATGAAMLTVTYHL